MKGLMAVVVVAVIILGIAVAGFNRIQASDEQVKAGWAEVLNQFQRRADLVPNLVSVVKGYAEHEKEIMTEVTAARAKVGAIQATAGLLDNPDAFSKFMAAQSELAGGLGRLLAVAENYPQLKADGSFRDLQAQLEGTENRIAVARNRFIEAVKVYNITVRSFPWNFVARAFGHTVKPTFAVEDEKALAKPPAVEFK